MARPASEFVFTYLDLSKLTGLSYENIKSHKKRGNFDPANLGSVVLFLARHGKLAFRREIVDRALMREKELPKVAAKVNRNRN